MASLDQGGEGEGRLEAALGAVQRAHAAALASPPFLGPSDVKVFAPPTNQPPPQPLSASEYEPTPDELKSTLASAAARREVESTFRTRAMREEEGKRRGRVYAQAAVRVRFPDETILQATFSSSAPTSLLLEWVGSSLRTPAAFHLSPPRGKPLLEMNISLQQAELVPASLLNFAPDEPLPPPFLNSELSAQMQPWSPQHSQVPH
ncbi:MAG: hypothetical protein SGPRY_013295, partial [Prymnesium sp.]